MAKVQIKASCEKRFRMGYPWVFSNELTTIPKMIPGEFVELVDANGKFLAVGFFHPNSLIAFRVVSRTPAVFNKEFILIKLLQAYRYRKNLGFIKYSHRLFYGQADGISGLIIDYYKSDERHIFVIQAQSAGANYHLSLILSALQLFCEKIEMPWHDVTIVIRNDASSRKKEHLELLPPTVWKGSESTLKDIRIHLPNGLHLWVDLFSGQKTGFFLDQTWNVLLIKERLGLMQKKLNVLDLCCYVGQWSAALAQIASIETTMVDASEKSLSFADKNLKLYGCLPHLICQDVFDAIGQITQTFDVIIVDPPAFIKRQKDVAVAKKAYLKLFTASLKLLKPEGIAVLCSCSGLLPREEFMQLVCKAASRANLHGRFVWGTQAWDHPIDMALPESEYLKVAIGFFENF
jgi:23S rRNA (cytosine1962-C5)-methyltransferase